MQKGHKITANPVKNREKMAEICTFLNKNLHNYKILCTFAPKLTT